MVIVAGVAAVATLLRVNRALRETAVSARSDPATHNAPPRAEAARLVTQGYAGMVSGHTHEPELSVVGNGFYANTGSGTDLGGRAAGRGLRLPHPFLTVRPLLLRRDASPASCSRSSSGCARSPVRSPGPARAVGPAPDQGGHVGHGAGGSPSRTGRPGPSTSVVLNRWVHRRRVRRVAARACSSPALLNVVFAAAVAPHRQPSRRPLAALRRPSALTVTEAIVAGLALCGLARGVRRGLRPAWLATIVAPAHHLDRPSGPGHSAGGVGHRPRLHPVAARSSTSTSGSSPPASPACSSGSPPPAWWSWPPPPASAPCSLTGHRHQFDLRLPLVLVVIVCSSCWCPARPGVTPDRHGPGARPSPGPAASSTPTEATRSTTSPCGTTSRGSSPASPFVAYSVINGVMLISPDPIGPPEDRAEVWSDVMDFAQSNNWTPSVLAASTSWLPIYRAAGLVDHYIGDEAIVDCPDLHPQGQVDEVAARGLQPDQEGGLPRRVLRRRRRRSRRPAPAAARAHDRDPAGRGRAGLLDDPEPHLRPPGHRPAAGRVLRRRRPAPRLQPVRPGHARSTATRSI